MKRKISILTILLSVYFSGVATHAAYTSRTMPAISINLMERTVETPQYIAPIDITYKTGIASWYSQKSPGIRPRTANNEIFNDQDMTCAIWGLPFNQKVKVTNIDNGKYVIVRVNDRGPHRRYVKKGRVIDLSQAAFAKIAPLKRGLINVKLELL